MNPSEIATFVRLLTSTNSTTFTDSDMKLILGVVMDELSQRIIEEVDEDYFGSPMFRDLVANQREYSLPDDLLGRIKYVEAKLDGTNYIPLKEFDLTNYTKTTDETTILKNFANEEGRAYFDIFRNSLWIYSGEITDVTDGIKLWGMTFPSHITDLTSVTDISIDPSATTHGFPRQFHRLLCIGTSRTWKQSFRKPIPLSEAELSYENDIKRELKALRNMNLNRNTIASVPSINNTEDNNFSGKNY